MRSLSWPLLSLALFPFKLDGAEFAGIAGLVGGGAIWGGCSRPMRVDALIGVGKAGFEAAFGLWAITLPDQVFQPSA